jgi:hypothetical protein
MLLGTPVPMRFDILRPTYRTELLPTGLTGFKWELAGQWTATTPRRRASMHDPALRGRAAAIGWR